MRKMREKGEERGKKGKKERVRGMDLRG